MGSSGKRASKRNGKRLCPSQRGPQRTLPSFCVSAVSGSLHEASYRRHRYHSLDGQLKKWEGTGGPMQAAALPLHCMRACRPEATERFKKKPEERNGPVRPQLGEKSARTSSVPSACQHAYLHLHHFWLTEALYLFIYFKLLTIYNTLQLLASREISAPF